MQLREYQQRAIDNVRASYARGRRAPCVVAPTGAGKTVIASEVIRLALTRGTRTLFLVPRIELLNQSVEKLARSGVTSVRTIQADNDRGDSNSLVTVASIPTLTTKRWLAAPVPADLVIVDECHHGKARTHEQLLSLYQRAKLLGLTATPQRGDGKALGDLFDSIVTVATVAELIDQRALVPARVYAPPRVMGPRELAQDPVDAYCQRAQGQKAIVFCSTVEHARRTADSFLALGIPARWVAGDSKDREETIAAFARDAFKVLVNVNCLVEGFDDPGIQTAILARRFTHVGSYLQAIGRVLRPHASKHHATVIDLVGSALVHGTPDMDREYTLDGKGITGKRQAIRQCGDCGGVFVSRDSCPFCGCEPRPLTRAQAKALGIQLEEVTAKTPKTSWPMRAQKPGACAACGGRIERGTWIIYSRTLRRSQHTTCAARAARTPKAGAAA